MIFAPKDRETINRLFANMDGGFFVLPEGKEAMTVNDNVVSDLDCVIANLGYLREKVKKERTELIQQRNLHMNVKQRALRIVEIINAQGCQ